MTRPPPTGCVERQGVMSKRAGALLLVMSAVAFFPSDAHAQKIPWIVLPLAASPVVAVLLAAALGVVVRSWSVGLTHALLVIAWVIWFVAASNYSSDDIVVWSSVAALALHALVMLWLIVLHAVRRVRGPHET